VQVEDQASRAIYVRLRHRARVLRGLAIGFVALIALTLAFGTIPYFLAGNMAVTESRAALEMRRLEAEQHAKTVEKRDRSAGEAADAGQPAQPQAQPSAAPAPAAGEIAGLAVSDEAFSAAVIRVTDVFLLVALTYLFGSLYRYSMRLASYYDEKADALRLLEAGDARIEARLAQITVPGAPGGGATAERERA
jgi:predicted lipid-binding transport protein (Tim44 family)